jgi:hypothetical protein
MNRKKEDSMDRPHRTPPRPLAASALGLALLLAAPTASASTYPLEQVLEKESAEKLEKAGVKTTDELLAKGAKPKELRALAKTTGLPEAKLGAWVKMCDLLRIKGVGPEMVRLLGAGKVSTVKQLRGQVAAKLFKVMIEANKKTKITQKPPAEEQVANWIEQAKKLELVLGS